MKLFSLSGPVLSNILDMAGLVHSEKSGWSPMMPDTIQFFPVDNKHIRAMVFCPFNGVDISLCVDNSLEKPVEMPIMQLKKIAANEIVHFELDENDLVVTLARARLTQRFNKTKDWEATHNDVPGKMDGFKEALKGKQKVIINADLLLRAVREASTVNGDVQIVVGGPEDPVLIQPRVTAGSISSLDALVMPKRNTHT